MSAPTEAPVSTLVNPPGLRPTSAYNHAVVRPGHPVFRQVSWDADGVVVGVGDIEVQVAQPGPTSTCWWPGSGQPGRTS